MRPAHTEDTESESRLSTVARFLSNKENRQKLEAAASAEEILAIFRSAS